MFGKRPADDKSHLEGKSGLRPSPATRPDQAVAPQALSQSSNAPLTGAPPPAAGKADMASTRPQAVPKSDLPDKKAEAIADKGAAKPKMTAGLEQLHKAQNVTEMVREQSD